MNPLGRITEDVSSSSVYVPLDDSAFREDSPFDKSYRSQNLPVDDYRISTRTSAGERVEEVAMYEEAVYRLQNISFNDSEQDLATLRGETNPGGVATNFDIGFDEALLAYGGGNLSEEYLTAFPRNTNTVIGRAVNDDHMKNMLDVGEGGECEGGRRLQIRAEQGYIGEGEVIAELGNSAVTDDATVNCAREFAGDVSRDPTTGVDRIPTEYSMEVIKRGISCVERDAVIDTARVATRYGTRSTNDSPMVHANNAIEEIHFRKTSLSDVTSGHNSYGEIKASGGEYRSKGYEVTRNCEVHAADNGYGTFRPEFLFNAGQPLPTIDWVDTISTEATPTGRLHKPDNDGSALHYGEPSNISKCLENLLFEATPSDIITNTPRGISNNKTTALNSMSLDVKPIEATPLYEYLPGLNLLESVDTVSAEAEVDWSLQASIDNELGVKYSWEVTGDTDNTGGVLNEVEYSAHAVAEVDYPGIILGDEAYLHKYMPNVLVENPGSDIMSSDLLLEENREEKFYKLLDTPRSDVEFTPDLEIYSNPYQTRELGVDLNLGPCDEMMFGLKTVNELLDESDRSFLQDTEEESVGHDVEVTNERIEYGTSSGSRVLGSTGTDMGRIEDGGINYGLRDGTIEGDKEAGLDGDGLISSNNDTPIDKDGLLSVEKGAWLDTEGLKIERIEMEPNTESSTSYEKSAAITQVDAMGVDRGFEPKRMGSSPNPQSSLRNASSVSEEVGRIVNVYMKRQSVNQPNLSTEDKMAMRSRLSLSEMSSDDYSSSSGTNSSEVTGSENHVPNTIGHITESSTPDYNSLTVSEPLPSQITDSIISQTQQSYPIIPTSQQQTTSLLPSPPLTQLPPSPPLTQLPSSPLSTPLPPLPPLTPLPSSPLLTLLPPSPLSTPLPPSSPSTPLLMPSLSYHTPLLQLLRPSYSSSSKSSQLHQPIPSFKSIRLPQSPSTSHSRHRHSSVLTTNDPPESLPCCHRGCELTSDDSVRTSNENVTASSYLDSVNSAGHGLMDPHHTSRYGNSNQSNLSGNLWRYTQPIRSSRRLSGSEPANQVILSADECYNKIGMVAKESQIITRSRPHSPNKLNLQHIKETGVEAGYTSYCPNKPNLQHIKETGVEAGYTPHSPNKPNLEHIKETSVEAGYTPHNPNKLNLEHIKETGVEAGYTPHNPNKLNLQHIKETGVEVGYTPHNPNKPNLQHIKETSVEAGYTPHNPNKLNLEHIKETGVEVGYTPHCPVNRNVHNNEMTGRATETIPRCQDNSNLHNNIQRMNAFTAVIAGGPHRASDVSTSTTSIATTASDARAAKSGIDMVNYRRIVNTKDILDTAGYATGVRGTPRGTPRVRECARANARH